MLSFYPLRLGLRRWFLHKNPVYSLETFSQSKSAASGGIHRHRKLFESETDNYSYKLMGQYECYRIKSTKFHSMRFDRDGIVLPLQKLCSPISLSLSLSAAFKFEYTSSPHLLQQVLRTQEVGVHVRAYPRGNRAF